MTINYINSPVVNAVTGTVNSGDTNILAEPGATFQYMIVAINLTNTSLLTVTTVLVKSGSTVLDRAYLLTGDSRSIVFDPQLVLRVAENTALTINVSASVTVSYSIHYFISSV